MYLEAKTAWMSLFNENVAKVWSSEIDELKNLAAVFYILKMEFSNLSKEIENKMDRYRNITASKKNEDAMNHNSSFIKVLCEKEKTPERNCDENLRVKNDKTEMSPQMMKKLNLLRSRKLKLPRLLQKENEPNDIIDTSIIDNTPDVSSIKKRKLNKFVSKKTKKPSPKNATLTQMFMDESLKQNDDKSPKVTDTTNDETTYLDLKEFSKTEEKRPKMNINANKITNFANEPVRGKARKKLKGWSCRECQQFYEAMDLSETQLLEKMNQCSRHRYKYKPPEDTPPVVWEVDISSSDESESSILFNFKSK